MPSTPSRRRKLGAVLLALFLIAIPGTACGRASENRAAAMSSPPASASTQPPATATPTPLPTPTDAEYAAQLCTSLNTYLEAFIKETTKDPTLLDNEAKLLKVAAPILAALGDDLARATPPDDVAPFHQDLVAKVKDVAQKANNGEITTIQQISDITSGVSEPPAETQARLQAAAANVKECQGSLLGGSVFG